ncbi:MAG: mechanosensitive ion channel family protein [Verrucomicrobiota bacterium]
MKWRFVWVYRLGLAVLLATAFWSVWASAQEAPNTPVVTTVDKAQHALVKFLGLHRVDWLRDNTFLGQPLWKYGASLIYILLAFYTAKLLDWIINSRLKRWAQTTGTKHDDLVLELLRGPVKVVTFVIFLNIGLNVFEWPERAQLFLSHALIIIVACSVTYVVLKVVDLIIGLWKEKAAVTRDRIFAEQLLPLLSKTIKISIVIIAALLTADNLNIKITGLLAGLSVGGLALGLAAQDTVANLFGAVAIFLDKPFHIGDVIKVESVTGTVEGIGLRSTCIRNSEGHHVMIPNKLMGNAIITNITRRPAIRTEMNFSLTYDTPAEKVERATRVLREIFQANPQTGELIISFNKFADSALNIFVVHVWNGTDARLHFAELQAMNLKIKERFDAEKIEFALPSQTVYLKPESGK